MKSKLWPLFVLGNFLVVTPSVCQDEPAGLKKELMNQLIGGLLGSAVGAGAGLGIGLAQGGDTESDKWVPAYVMYGNVLGNSLGHSLACSGADHKGPLILSLVSGSVITLLMTSKISTLDSYYDSFLIGENDQWFWTSLLLIQPIVTTSSHLLWPKSKKSMSMIIGEHSKIGLIAHQSF